MFKTFIARLNQKPFLKLVVGLALIVYVYLIVSGAFSCIESKLTKSQISRIEKQANTALQEAADQSRIADNSRTDRATEDQIRERTITPELTHRRQSAENTRSRLNNAQTDYENAQNPHPSDPADGNALYKRNCSDLNSLYPNKRFTDCP